MSVAVFQETKVETMPPKNDDIAKIVSKWPYWIQALVLVIIASGGGSFVGSEILSGGAKFRQELSEVHKHVEGVDKELDATRQLHNDAFTKQSESIAVIFERQLGMMKRLEIYESDMREIKKLLMEIQFDQRKRAEAK